MGGLPLTLIIEGDLYPRKLKENHDEAGFSSKNPTTKNSPQKKKTHQVKLYKTGFFKFFSIFHQKFIFQLFHCFQAKNGYCQRFKVDIYS